MASNDTFGNNVTESFIISSNVIFFPGSLVPVCNRVIIETSRSHLVQENIRTSPLCSHTNYFCGCVVCHGSFSAVSNRA